MSSYTKKALIHPWEIPPATMSRMEALLLSAPLGEFSLSHGLLTPYLYNSALRRDLFDYLRLLDVGIAEPLSYQQTLMTMGEPIDRRLGQPAIRDFTVRASTKDQHLLAVAANILIDNAAATRDIVDHYRERTGDTSDRLTFGLFASLANTIRMAPTLGTVIPASVDTENLRDAFTLVFSRKGGRPRALAQATAQAIASELNTTIYPDQVNSSALWYKPPRQVLQLCYGVTVPASRSPRPHRFKDPVKRNTTLQEVIQILLDREIRFDDGGPGMFPSHYTLRFLKDGSYRKVRACAAGIPGLTPSRLIELIAKMLGRRVSTVTVGELDCYYNLVAMAGSIAGPISTQYTVVDTTGTFHADLHIRFSPAPVMTLNELWNVVLRAMANKRYIVEFHGPYHYGLDGRLADKTDVHQTRLTDDRRTRAYLKELGAPDALGAMVIVDFTAHRAFMEHTALMQVLAAILQDTDGEMPGWIFIQHNTVDHLPGTEYPGNGNYNVTKVESLDLTAKWISARDLAG